MTLGLTIGIGLLVYLVLSLVGLYLVQAMPRRPIVDPPDWGTVTDTRIPNGQGESLEVWRIEPETPSRGIVLLVHGWGRNRDRMVNRARLLGRWGYTTVIHSARDHGHSSPRRFMNAARFAEDIETVRSWIDEPAILYGHSAGAAGAILTASRNPAAFRALILEACYAETAPALLSLYRWVNWVFGVFFGPVILFWMQVFHRKRLKDFDPIALVPAVKIPTLIVHGEKDRRFPVAFAQRLYAQFPEGQAELFIAEGAGHSDSSLSEKYPGAVKQFFERHVGLGAE